MTLCGTGGVIFISILVVRTMIPTVDNSRNESLRFYKGIKSDISVGVQWSYSGQQILHA